MTVTTATHARRGQVLIITAFAMAVVLGVAALVVDLGMSWMLRRQEQNAADPAAIAAARWLKDPATGLPTMNLPEMNADACFYAQENGFFETDSNCASALASGDLVVKSPPISGPMSARAGYVQVIIRSSHPTFFGRIFGADSATVTTSAVAANTAGNSNSNSLVALKSECQAGAAAEVSGGGEVRIVPAPSVTAAGGYVYVNSTCGMPDDICENGTGQSALAISGKLTTPFANVVGSCTYSGSPPNGLACYPSTVTACLDEGVTPLGDPLQDMPRPNLDAFPAGVCPDGSVLTKTSTGCTLRATGPNKCPIDDPANPGGVICELQPGVYYGGFDIGGKVSLKLKAGMYILAGFGIKQASDAEITAVEGLTGTDARITIYSTDGPNCATIAKQCQGDISVNAKGAFSAKAINTTTCQAIAAAGGPNTCPWRGILLWQDGSGSGADKPISLGGQAKLHLAGTIYAPKAAVTITGGSSTSGCSDSTGVCLSLQIISYTWKIAGGGLLEMPYDPSELYRLDQRGLVD